MSMTCSPSAWSILSAHYMSAFVIIYFKTFVWKVYYVLGTVLVTRDTTESKTDKVLVFMKVTLS